MNPAAFALRNRVLILVLTAVMLLGGIRAFSGMSRLEDPEFTIKDALVVTSYPGASAAEVEEEVTDEIEIAVQALAQIDEVTSRSERGLSTVTVTIQDRYDKSTLPQVWDELRRKVGDAQSKLPPGAGPSLVVDDYGDVYGVFFALYGDEYSQAELKQVADLLRRELLLVEDVAKIDTFGERTETIQVELDRDRMSQLGISPEVVVDQLRRRNLVTESGRVEVGPEFVALHPTGTIRSVEDFEALLVAPGSGQQVHLRDIGTVTRSYLDPPGHLLRYDGKPAIGLGISTASGGNVVAMGRALERRVDALLGEIPYGIEAGIVSLQSEAVTKAIRGFTSSLVQAVVIVIVVLLLFMGLRSGLLIGFVLVLTIVGSFIFLDPMGVALERISLGALIIALGMLVDNAIVVVDGVLVRMGRGQDAAEAGIEVVGQSALPLLGATVIAILAFAAIGTSQDSTGEFCRSLYQVVMVSLGLSWLTAVTVTPLLCALFLKPPAGKSAEGEDPYGGGFYASYRGFVRGCIRRRWLTMAAAGGLFAASLAGFGRVEQSFFPPSTRPQFMVDLWLPQGSHIDRTVETVEQVESYVLGLEGVTHVTSLVGRGGLRFLLTYGPEKASSSYAQLLVDVDDPSRIDALQAGIERSLAASLPDVLAYVSKFELGPGANGKIRARWSGPDPAVLRRLAGETEAILAADPVSKGIRNDWRAREKVIRPVLAEQEANLNGITRAEVAKALLQGFEGDRVGVYREGDLRLPIVLRGDPDSRDDVSDLRGLQIWSPAAGRMIPLRQVVSGFEVGFQDAIIQRRDRKRTVTVFADPRTGPASTLFARVRPAIEALEAPPGYTLEWGGEYEDSAEAQAGIAGSIPVFVLLMLVITVGLFDSLRKPLAIWLNVPLALIGVTAGLLLTGQPFGFMALLGFLSLIGMLIKNGIVLMDEIDLQAREEKPLLAVLLDSGASRLRPVAMAASTTALGMVPLLLDAFFVSMAVTIIFGLLFATVLTMVVLPVAYAILLRVPAD